MAQATQKKKINDSPTVHASAAKLDQQGTPEAFVYMTKAGHRITWPDPLDMDFEDAEEFLDDLNGKRNSEVLPKWIGDDDYAALKADHLSLKKLRALLDMVVSHYQGVLGDEGEGDASGS